MYKARRIKNISLRKLHRVSLSSSYDFLVYDMSLPLKATSSNLSNFQLQQNNKELGLLLNDVNMLDMRSNDVVFDSKKALAQGIQNKIVLNLIEPTGVDFMKWIDKIREPVSIIGCPYVLIPTNSNLNIQSFSECNKAIQEFNMFLYDFTLDTKVVIKQGANSLSALSYLVNHLNNPENVYISIDIDEIENEFYSFSDILSDLIKYDIINRVAFVKSSVYSTQEAKYKRFIGSLPNNVIIYNPYL